EIEKIKDDYDPKAIYENNYKVRRVLDALIDGTLDDGGTKVFKELHSSILKGASWHSPDQYYLLLDFDDYLQTFLKLNEDYKNKKEFAKKQWLNMCNAGKFSSDRTILQYAQEIWHIDKV
ncbi:MAG: glycogen/starch/alpha-glucan phosphorylase, partial [Acutalibacteraceae bacterium]